MKTETEKKVKRERPVLTPYQKHIKKLKKIKKPINIFDATNPYSYFLVNSAEMDREDFSCEPVIFDFDSMKDGMDFYRVNRLSEFGWQCISGHDFQLKYNFYILKMRNKLLMQRIKKCKTEKKL